MATKYWTGGTDGNFGTAGNWLGGAAPTNSDTVVFDRGSVDVDAGLTTGLTGLTMIGNEGYKGRIAPGGSSINAAFSSVRWAAGSANLAGNITLGKFEPRPGSLITYNSGTLAAGYFANTELSIAAAAVVTTIRAKRCRVDDLYNATAYTLAELVDGTVLKSKRGGKVVVHAASTAEILDAGALSTGSVVRSRGLLKYLSSAAVSGTVDVETSGRLDARDNSVAFDFSSGTLNLWPDAIYDLNTRAGLVEPGTLNSYSLSTSSNAGSPIPIP